MPAPTLLARCVALALLGVTGYALAAPQADPTQNTAQQNTTQQNTDQEAVPLLPQQQPQQTATPPNQGEPQDEDIEPIGPPKIPEVPPANVPLFSWTLEAGVEQSNNINRSEDNPVSQTLLVPRYTFTYDQSGSTLQAHAIGQVEYLNYLQGDFNNRVLGALAGSLNWDIVPQRLALSVLDASTVQSVDILTSNAPGNLQQVNVLSIGPVLSFRMGGGTWHGQLEGHYIDTLASNSKGFDTQREFGAFRVIDDLNATDQISGNVEAEHVHVQNPDLVLGPIGTGYDRYDAYLHYLSNIKSVTLDLTLGESRFSFGNGFPDENGVLARAAVDWHVDLHNSFSIGGARHITDAAEDMLLYPDQVLAVREMGIGDLLGLGVGNAVVTSDVYRERLLDGNYTWAGDRLRVSVGPYYRRINYLGDVTLDRNERGAGMDVSWRLTPLMTLAFDAGVVRTNYTTLDRRDTTYGFGPSLTDQFTPHWSWRAALIHNHRNSTEAGRGYTENAGFFLLTYKP